MTIRVSFSRCSCPNCGTQHYLMEACPSCRAQATQIDPEVERRRVLVQAAMERLHKPCEATSELTPYVALARLVSVGRRFLDAIEPFASGQTQPMEGVIDEYRLLCATATGIARLRPFIGAWRAVDSICATIGDSVELALKAVAAPTPPKAEELLESSYKQLLNAIESANLLRERANWLSLFAEASPDDRFVEIAKFVFRQEPTDMIQRAIRGSSVSQRLAEGTQLPYVLGCMVKLLPWQ